MGENGASLISTVDKSAQDFEGELSLPSKALFPSH